MRKLLISIPIARTVRYFLDTKVFDDIVSFCNENNIQIFILHKQTDLSNFYKSKNITELKYPAISKFSKAAHILRTTVNLPSIVFRNIFYKRTSFWEEREPLKHNVKKLISLPFVLFLYNIPFIGKRIFRKAFRDPAYTSFLKEHDFNAVILNLPEVIEERLLAQSCNDLGIPVVTGCDGWDTWLTAGYVQRYNGALVWGPDMGALAKELGFKNDQLIFSGMPHKSRILNFIESMDINEIRKKYNLATNDKVILIPLNRWYQTNDMEKNFIGMLLSYIENQNENNYVIILRNNPGGIPRKEDINYHELYKDNKHIRFQTPARYFMDAWQGHVDNDILREVAELFAVSDCIFSITSLFMLEGASADIPFALYNIKEEKYNVRYVTKTAFYKSLLEMGIPELTDYNDIPAFLERMIDNKNTNYVKVFNSAFDYCAPDYINKLFSILRLIAN